MRPNGEPAPGVNPRKLESNCDERALADGLIAKDEAAFFLLVDRYNRTMTQVAWRYAPSLDVAEEVVQETWLAVVRSIQNFEHRSSIKTWIFRILLNIARRRAYRESRSIPLSTFIGDSSDSCRTYEESLTGAMHRSTGKRAWLRGALAHFPSPERRLLGVEVRAQVEETLRKLPRRQSLVVQLRDLEGWTSQEVCEAMDISSSNQRVLLHRGRAKLRDHLERDFGTGGEE